MKLFLFNAPVIPNYGTFRFEGPVTPAEVAALLRDGFVSAVGHASTARWLSDMLGLSVEARRISVEMAPGDRAVVFRLAEKRLEEGQMLTDAELRSRPFEFGLLTRLE